MLRPVETTPLDLEASLLLDSYIRLRIAYKPLNRSWCLSLCSRKLAATSDVHADQARSSSSAVPTQRFIDVCLVTRPEVILDASEVPIGALFGPGSPGTCASW